MTIHTDAIQKLYVAYFSRPADPAGLAYWENIVALAKGNTAAVSAAFAASAEYQAAYAGMNALQVVDVVYLNLFGRNAETAGLQYWAPLLSSGKVSIDAIVTAVAGGAQSTDLVAFNSKATAATAFSAALDTPAEILAYQGAAANAAAKAFLASVVDVVSLQAALKTVADGWSPTPKPPLPPAPEPAPAPGGLVVVLGSGDDKLGNISVKAGDWIDGGAGIDTVMLEQVGAANYTAFRNFERLEASEAGTFDLSLLAGKNNIAEVLVTGATQPGSLVLSNAGAGTALRLAADAASVELTQAVPGRLAVTVEHDETATPTAAWEMEVDVRNATALDIVFDSDFKVDRKSALGANDSPLNGTLLTLASSSSTSIELMSGGDHAVNYFNFRDDAAGGSLESVTVLGTQRLYFLATGASKLATVDASAHTGGLFIATGRLADGGTVKLGAGVDRITVSSNSVPTGAEAVLGFEKAAAAALGDVPSKAAAAVADADTLVFAGGAVANAATVEGGALNAQGVLSFSGMGPATLAAAFAIAELAAETAGEVLVFDYLGSAYAFMQGSDVTVKLVGVTGITAIAESGSTDGFFIV